MTIDDLAVIISAQLAFLLAIVAMKIYVRQTDVLSGRYHHIDRDQSSTLDEHIAPPDAKITEPNPQARAFPFPPAQRARSNAPQKSTPQTDAETETGLVRDVGPLQI